VFAKLSPEEFLSQFHGDKLKAVSSLDVSRHALASMGKVDLSKAFEWFVANEKYLPRSDDPFNQGPHMELVTPLAEYLRRDPDKALSLLLTHENRALTETFAHAVADDSSEKVWAWLMANAARPGVSTLQMAMIREQAGDSPREYLSLIGQEKSPATRQQLLGAVVQGVLHQQDQNSDVLERVLSGLPRDLAGDLRLAAFGKVALHASVDLTPWFTAYTETSGEVRRQAAASLAQAMARRDLMGAKAWAAQQNEPTAWEGVYEEWVQQNPQNAVEGLQILEEHERPIALRGVVLGMVRQEPALAAEWIVAEANASWREETARRVLQLIDKEAFHSSAAWLSLAKDKGLGEKIYEKLIVELNLTDGK